MRAIENGMAARPRTRRLLAAGPLFALIVLLAGCHGPPPKPAEFNDALADYNDKLFAIGLNFRAALMPLLYQDELKSKEPVPFTPSKVRSVQADAEKAVKEIRSKFYYLQAPTNSPSGEQLRDAYDQYLKIQELIATDLMKQIATVAEDEKNPERAQRIQKLMNDIETQEMAAMGDLDGKLTEFRKAHNLNGGRGTIISPPNQDKQKMPGK